jgi:hypothetical protein
MEQAGKKIELTDNEKEVLGEAKAVFDRPYNGVLWGTKNTDGNRYNGWFTPLSIGGGNRSHHSYTLKKLLKKGLIESQNRGGILLLRGSRVYRITESGLKYIEENFPEKTPKFKVNLAIFQKAD